MATGYDLGLLQRKSVAKIEDGSYCQIHLKRVYFSTISVKVNKHNHLPRKDRLPMDINEIASIVQQQFLRRRKHLPMIFVELESTGIQVLALAQLDEQKGKNTARRARMLFDAGRRFGQRTKWTRPSVTGLCMARLSAPQGILNEGMLIIKMDEGNRLNCTARFYEMHKEAGGTSVIFLENPFLSGEGLVSPLLPAFMLGIDTIRSQQSTNEASRMLSALLHEYEEMKRGIGYYERFPDIITHY